MRKTTHSRHIPLGKLKFFVLIGIMTCVCAACGSKKTAANPFASAPKKAASNDFLTDSPLKKLSASDDFSPLLASVERGDYCLPNFNFDDDLISENLFEMALKAPTSDIYNRILEAAFSQLGKRYRAGGDSPASGFDCSGFTTWVFNRYGIDLPRSSREQYQIGNQVAKNQLKKGDLVFFARKSRINHVGIYLEDGKFIHSASAGKDVQVSSLDEDYWRDHYAGGRRVIRK